jgi:Lon protease-like protein
MAFGSLCKLHAHVYKMLFTNQLLLPQNLLVSLIYCYKYQFIIASSTNEQDNVFKKTKMHIVMVAKLGTIVLSTSTLDSWIFKGNYKTMFDSIEEIQVGGIFSYDKI